MADHGTKHKATSADRVQPLLADLTGPQLEAVKHVHGPLLVLAGPGSGKTRVVTRRMAHMVLGVGIAPWNVLAITFTNKAAAEMQQRVAELVSLRQARALTVCTFHSLCARLLRQYADRLELPPGYSIYDVADQQQAVKQALGDLEINPKNFPPSNLLTTISNAKNELSDAQAYAKAADDFYSRTVAKVYVKYDQILRRNHALDFDDLLLNLVLLLKHHRDVLAELQDRYQYILIDEYQDTNHAQFMIASELAGRHKNICATGDPDQSIYGWRGANIRNILDFESHFPAAQVVCLEQNYRSTPQILAAADSLIRHNKGRKHKRLWTQNTCGEPIRLVTCHDEHQEADWVVVHLQQIHQHRQVAWGSMAVFYRVNSLSRVIEDALRDAGIPYQIARGTAFYQRAEVKNVVAYLRLIVNPADEVSLARVINTPARGISDRSVKALRAFALANQCSIDAAIADPVRLTALSSRARKSVAKFSELVDGWRRDADLDGQTAPAPAPGPSKATEAAGSLRAFVEGVLRGSGLEQLYRNDRADPEQQRLANLGEFVSFTQQFEQEYLFQIEVEGDGHRPKLAEKLLAFLERISLISDVDAVDSDQGAVTLMTLHAAKGLEFPVVAMIGAEDGLLPHQRATGDEKELEEERRLCFVGITRAMRTLLVTHVKYRTIFGRKITAIPSRFLGQLAPEVVQAVDVSDEAAGFDDFEPAGGRQRSLPEKVAGQYAPGTWVHHPKFGRGRVINVSPTGEHTRATVKFDTAGSKTLILQYARMQII